MKIIKKVITTGTSLGIVLDKIITDSLKISKGDFVEVDIKKVKKNE